MHIGFMELFVIIIVALIIIDKDMAKALLQRIKTGVDELKNSEEYSEIKEATSEIKDVAKDVTDVKNDILN